MNDDDDDGDDGGADGDDGDGKDEQGRGHPPDINPPWSFRFAVAFAIRQNSVIRSRNPSVCAPYVVSRTKSALFASAAIICAE